MLKRLAVAAVFAASLALGGANAPGPIAAEMAKPLLKSTEPAEICLRPEMFPDEDSAYQGTQAGGAAEDRRGPLAVPADWPGKDVVGGDVPPTRLVYDPYPHFDGIAIDPDNNLVVMSDENRSGLLMYERTAGSQSRGITEPKRHIIGPKAELGFIAGVTLDAKRREAWVVNNDGGGVTVFSYDQHGDVKPVRKLEVPHQSWGLSLDLTREEIAVTSQQYQGISIYARMASGTERPLRTIRGDDTQLADPHGVYLDGVNDEVYAANHGNWTEMRSYADDAVMLPGEYKPGRFEQPSIRIYQASGNGNAKPTRSIQGKQTQLAWPMGIDVSRDRNELAVANYGTNAILIYPRTASGDVAPARVISGARTGIIGPVGVVFDTKNRELWVANYGDHTALVFDIEAAGNVEPKRIVRNAPAGTPTTGFTNASAAAYDSKRDELLVPN